MEIADRSEFKRTMNSLLQIDPARTVALTVDMQREYLDESVGHSVVLPSEAERVLAAAKSFLDECRARTIPVVHVYVARRPEELAHGFRFGGLEYLLAGAEAGASQLPHRPLREAPDRPEGSAPSQVPASLVADGDIHVTSKKSLDGFAHTELEFLLRRIVAADTLLLMGVNTDTCVYSTTFTAANLGFRPIVISDCVASMRGVDSHEMALELMARSIAWVVTGEEALARIVMPSG